MLRKLLSSIAMLAVSPALLAQTYPTKPIEFIVTVPAGGSIDGIARAVAKDVSAALGQPVIVNNRPGANGNIAAEYVRKSPADGYTLLVLASSTFTLGPYIYKKISFDPVKDFAPVAMTAGLNMVLVTSPKLDVKDVGSLVTLMKNKPGELNYGSSGNGSLSHVGGELLNLKTGTQAMHVAYKGIAPAMNDLLGGQIDFMFDSGTAMPHITSGKLKALAVVGPKRLDIFPDVPTLKEAGIEGMEVASGWHGIFAPAGTPAAIVQRLNKEINASLRTAAVRERIRAMGLESVTSTPEELGAALRTDLKRLGPVAKQANIVPQ